MPKKVEAILHAEETRTNIPPAEFQMAVPEEVRKSVQVSWKRRNPDLDPQLVWRGKFDGDADLTVQAPALFIQEEIWPKELVKRLMAEKGTGKYREQQIDPDLKRQVGRMEFYKHEEDWRNRFILGDSLQVMASLAEREQGLRGCVQAVYFDPPYGIKFGSNFQWCSTQRDVKDGRLDNMTREPEQIRAFRDTWKDGIHSYLSYIRDRLIVARDLLADSGSLFLQIGEENVHRVRCVLDEVFGEDNFVAQIAFATTSSFSSTQLPTVFNYILWYGRDKTQLKYRQLYSGKDESTGSAKYKKAETIGALKNMCIAPDEFVQGGDLTSQGASNEVPRPFVLQGKEYFPAAGLHWKTTVDGLERLDKAQRIIATGGNPRYLRKLSDFRAMPLTNSWTDIGGVQSRSDPKVYVVQTAVEAIARCILMSTDPGDLVLDPTCGSGTTAYAAEQWGRRWITIDTSRVALVLAKSRLMGAVYPYYYLADSKDGQIQEATLADVGVSNASTGNNIKAGFVYERVPHVKLGDIAKNAEIDVIHARWQKTLEPLRESLNAVLGESFEEWEIPREAPAGWSAEAKKIHDAWWKARTARQKEIDVSISKKASFEPLYDQPLVDKDKVRVSGPFTVESVSPYRSLDMNENGELVDPASRAQNEDSRNYVDMVLENLRKAGIQQARKGSRLVFSTVSPWAGNMLTAAGDYEDEEGVTKKAAIFIGPEFGTVGEPAVMAAAKEAASGGFDVLVAAAFSFDAQAESLEKFGILPILKTRMNSDLHMGGELKSTGAGNLFVVFGEPDIRILHEKDKAGNETGNIRVKVKGVDVFNPVTGEIRSSGPEDIAAWFIDDEYNEKTFFVRQTYFFGAKSDPYKAMKTTLKAEISPEVWATLRSDVSRPFRKPKNGRIAVKVINIFGDEVLRSFSV